MRKTLLHLMLWNGSAAAKDPVKKMHDADFLLEGHLQSYQNLRNYGTRKEGRRETDRERKRELMFKKPIRSRGSGGGVVA